MKQKYSKIYFEEVSAAAIAETYGTPTYVYEANRIRDNYQRLFSAFKSRWENFQIYYALKSNSNSHVAQILIDEGAFMDCASAVEVALAQKLGLSGARILFSGNFLSDEDIQAGLQSHALFNLDDLSLLDKMLKQGRPEVLSFRINPGVGKSNVHESDVFAGKEAKFGLPWEEAETAYAAAKKAGVKRFGVHMMCGSCVTEPDYFREVTEKLLDCVGPIAKKLGIHFEFIDIGGGFGIPYSPEEKELDIEETAEQVVTLFRAKVEQYQLGDVRLLVEPGRYLVGDAGFVVGRVHALKKSYKKFAGTDIGMNILARPFIYGAYHHILVDGKENAEENITITGQCCENADAWGQNRFLPKMEVGDLIVVENAGAYGFTMSFPYNGRLRAAEVLVDGNQHRLIRKRETVEDWLSGT